MKKKHFYLVFIFILICISGVDVLSIGASNSYNFPIFVNPGDSILITDTRDGNVYKAIRINGIWWFAENVRLATPNSYCYGHDSLNCEVYGRLYKHKDIHLACPDGWRLPSPADFDNLINFLKENELNNNNIIEADYWAGRSKDSIDNATGLSIRGSGWKVKKKFSGVGTAAHLWLFDPDEPALAHHVHMGGAIKDWGGADLPYRHHHNNIINKRYFSCRCVKE